MWGNTEQKVDNSFVVACNPKLMCMFSCHRNLELPLSRVCGIKYCFKYICKRNSRVIMQIVEETGRYNRIEHLLDARYVSVFRSRSQDSSI